MAEMRTSQFNPGLQHASAYLWRFLLLAMLCTPFFRCFAAQDVTDDRKKLYIDEQLRLADGLSRRGHYQLAIEEYRKIIDKFPDDPLIADALSQMADAYSSAGDLQRALATYQLFFKKFPDLKTVPAVKVNYAAALFKTGTEENRRSASSMLEELKSSPGISPEVRRAASYNLGKFNAELGRNDLAKKEFSSLASKNDLYAAYAQLELASIFDKENNGDEALKNIRALTDSKDTPPEVMCAALNYLAGYFSRKKQHQEAAELYEQILVQFPDTPAGREAYFRKFESLFLAREFPRLMKELDAEIGKSSGVDSQSEKLYYIKASIQMEQGLLSDARKTLSAIILSPKSSIEYYSKAATMSVQCLIGQAKLNDAEKEAGLFFKNPRISVEAKLAISGNLSKVLTSPHAKTTVFKEAVNSARDVKERTILRLALASTLANLSQVDTSLSLYKDILSDCPDEFKPECLYGMAKCQELLKNEKEAIITYRRLVDSYPSSPLQPDALLRVAILTLYEKPDSDEPRVILNKLVKDCSSNRDIYGNAVFYLAYMDFIKGEFSKAAEGFRKTASDSAYDPNLLFLSKEYLLWSIISEKPTTESDKLFEEISSSAEKMSSLNPELLILLGKKCSESGRTDAAEKCYTALIRSPDGDSRLRGYMAIGLLHQKKGEIDKALKSFRDAEKVLTQDKALQADLLSLLGMALLAKGEKNEASLVFEKCIENAASRNAAARARLGLGKMLSENNEDLTRANRYAMSVFILSDDPDLSRQALLLSIDISMRQNKLDEAKKTFAELKKRFPELLNDENVKKLAEKLK